MSKLKAAALPVSNILDKALTASKEAEKVKPYVEMTDEELVKAIQKGDKQAYSHVVNRYQGKIYAYVMRLTNHRDEAYDITQDVFLKAYKHLHRFDTDRKFSSWIYRIAHNESVNWLKKKTRVKMESLESHVENGYQLEGKTDIHAEMIRKQEQHVVRKAIASLPEKYRKVMVMRYAEQLSYQEIAKKLDKPINTIGTLINRAKKRLASEMKEAQ